MKIVVLAERFEDGAWKGWEHTCLDEEIEAVVDSAMAKAADHRHPQPTYIDYLQGIGYIFDVAYGPKNQPKDGDTKVYAAIVDGVLIGMYEKVQKYLSHKKNVA